MVRWVITEDKLPGFAYYPMLEIGTGIFLMLAALVVPVLFFVYNGIKTEQWAELLFCAGFFILFMFMGKALTFQSLTASLTSDGFTFYQNMREPPVSHRLDRRQWQGIRTSEEKNDDETMVILKLKTSDGELELYRSVNKKEINALVGALNVFYKKAEEANK